MHRHEVTQNLLSPHSAITQTAMKNIFSKSTITSLVIVGLSLMPALRVSATSLSATPQAQQSISEIAQSPNLEIKVSGRPSSCHSSSGIYICSNADASGYTEPLAQRVRQSPDSNLKLASSDSSWDPFSLDWLCKTTEGRRHPWSSHVICPTSH